MSPHTWTPEEVSSELRPYAAEVYRSVEAQHLASTMKVTDTLEEQHVLEELIERHKPALPAGLERLHYLLFTPFRYFPAYPGSRFRARNDPRGAFYAAERESTALLERAFYTLLGMAESISEAPPRWRGQVTVFAVPLALARAADLTSRSFDRARALWVHPCDYAACQRFAETAREAGAKLIRYESARDPAGGANVALFDPAGFARREPTRHRTWHLEADARGVRAVEAVTRRSLDWLVEGFAADPRLAPFRSTGD